MSSANPGVAASAQRRRRSNSALQVVLTWEISPNEKHGAQPFARAIAERRVSVPLCVRGFVSGRRRRGEIETR